ncbi:hypothetical protein [Ralstonia wenshanensis]|uniref:hypothetical protein n=1 Tax=Ralstonia wenshanensis TaxID=2842456 RepID=UPI002AACB2BB|nr:hypothetical protein [Ralstonia wenshanensis]MDY7511234.1 hypothetical protein [Ralstonia wenshanensis]
MQAAWVLQGMHCNVTTSVKLLKERVCVTSFRRDGKKSALTLCGRRRSHGGPRLQIRTEAAQQSICTAVPNRRLRIGRMEGPEAKPLLMAKLRYLASRPDAEQNVTTGTTRSLVAPALDCPIDWAVLARPSTAAAHHVDIDEFG